MKQNELLGGLILGAGLMYLLDPERGNRRRAVIRDQAVHLAHQLDDGLDTAARDMGNRARGLAMEATARVRPDHAPDGVVEARVRSALGRLVSHPGAIHVQVVDGRVTLTGDVLADEMTALRRGVAAVRGVREVTNRVDVHSEPGDVPGLQGERVRPEPRMDVLQSNWSPGTRLIAGVVGGALALRGLRGGGTLDSLATLAGIGLLSRAATNLDMSRLSGVNAGRRAVELQKIITVNAPVEEVFAFWSNFENFPLFMSHLRAVRRTGDGRSRWEAEGPGGIPVEWDAEITGWEQNRAIAWKSIGTSPVENAGIVRFQAEQGERTRLDIHLSYNPPAGAVGHAIASLLGSNPRQMMHDDLVRLKSLLEEGKTSAHGHTVRREEIPVPEGGGSAR